MSRLRQAGAAGLDSPVATDVAGDGGEDAEDKEEDGEARSTQCVYHVVNGRKVI